VLLRSIAAATLIVSLGGCVQRDYLVANPSDDGGPASETRYTSNLSYVASVEMIPLRIDPAFVPDERREILRSVAEWNHALNGHVRFDPVFMVFQPGTAAANASLAPVDTVPPRSNGWSILPARGATPLGRRIVLPMALTQPAPHGGGIVMVYREQTGTLALAAAIRHELGHVLGLLHDPASRLMSPLHDPLAQRCIDKAAVAAVARIRALPVAELNWCEEIAAPG
jgi:hypothetical protein